MGEKLLTEAAWKSFGSKGGDYKDAPLIKALAALAKAEKTGPAQELEALDDIDRQLDVLRKAHRADKALIGQLEDMDKALARQRKSSELALKDADKGDGDEDDSPALLGSKLIPLLRELRKGEAVMPALVLVAGKDAAVLISRRAISPSRGKLLKEYLKASGAVKLITADCRFENNAHTFVVHGEPAAGLAKKLRGALLAQTDMKLKVRVRGEDPNDVDEDGDDAEAQAPSGLQATGTTAPPPGPDAEYAALWAELQPQLVTALREKHPEATKLRAVSGFASDKAAADDYAGAVKALQMLAKLLAVGVTAPSGDSIELTSALNGWKQARNAVLLQLKDVLQLMKEALAEDPADEVARQAELQVQAVMRQLTAEPREPGQVRELQTWLSNDEIVDTLDQEVGALRAPLLSALQTVQQAQGNSPG